MSARPCVRCEALGVTRPHGLCPDCIEAEVFASAKAQGLPELIPADDDRFARIDALTRPR